MKVDAVHHISLRSQDPQRARSFYERVIGLEFMDLPVSGATTSIWRGAPADGVMFAAQVGGTFLVISPPLEGTDADDRFSERRIGLDHLAFAVSDRSELERLVEALRADGVATEGIEMDPVLGKEYVAFRDPDNVQWEAYMSG
jgi:glyoxylase I family protein